MWDFSCVLLAIAIPLAKQIKIMIAVGWYQEGHLVFAPVPSLRNMAVKIHNYSVLCTRYRAFDSENVDLSLLVHELGTVSLHVSIRSDLL